MSIETTITKVVSSEWQGKKKYTMTLANGVTGYLQDGSDADLREGENVVAEIKPYTSKAGKQSNLLTLKRAQYVSTSAQQAASIPQPQPQAKEPTMPIMPGKSIQEQKVYAAVEAYGFVVGAVGEGKLDWPQVAEKQKEAANILWNEIEEIYNEK